MHAEQHSPAVRLSSVTTGDTRGSSQVPVSRRHCQGGAAAMSAPKHKQAIATPRARSEGQGVANSNYMPLQLPRSWPCCIVAVARVRDAAAHYRHRSHLRAAWCWQGCRRSKQGRRPVRWCRRLRRAERHAQARGALAPLMPAPTAAHRTAAPLRCCAAARRCTPMQPLRRCTLLQPLRRCIPLHAAAQRCTHSPHALVSRSVPSAGAHAPTDAGAPLRGGAREEPAV